MKPTKGHTYLPDELVREIGDSEAILACRLNAFAEAQDGDSASVSIAYLAKIYGWSDNKVRRIAEKLQTLGYWYREDYSGNGGTSIWHKGESMIAFQTLQNGRGRG